MTGIPLSKDLRERVLKAVLSGESRRSAARRFGVSAASVVRWTQRHHATGSIAPLPRGRRKSALEPHREFLLDRIRHTPHLTLNGLKDELAARGLIVSHNAVWLFMQREGLSFKKNAIRP